MKHTVLVTGANGQLGNEMRRVSAVADADNQYVFTDVIGLESDPEVLKLDITDLSAVREIVKENKVDVIVNCAAYTNVDKAEDDVELCDLLNNKAVENLAIAAKEVDATLIHISTDYVFKGDKCMPCKEDWETDPQGVYGVTKLAGERSIARVGARHIIFRTAWLYSPFGKNFVKTMQMLTSVESQKTREAAGKPKGIKVVFDQVGTPTYAGDLAAVIVKVIHEDMLDKQGIYHFSNEGVCSWYDFALEIAALSGNECRIDPCHSDEFPSKVKRPHFSVLDKTKVKETFGVGVPYWKDSLKKCIEELKG